MVKLFKTKIKYYQSLITSISIFLLAITQISCQQNKSNNSRITIASKGKIESLDPAQVNKLLAIQIINLLGDPLYSIASDGSLKPILAKDKPEISSDGLTISIPLREDVLFHDGTPFNSEAMAFSIKRFIKIGTLNYIVDGRIKNIDATNPYLLKLKLTRPSSSIKGLLTSINLTPISPKAYSEHTDRFLNDNFIGTGPYKLKNYSPERQTFEVFEKYWGEKATNSGINYVSFNTSTSLFSAIRTGQVDILLSNSIDDGHRLALHRLSKKNLLLEGEGPAMQIGYIALNSNSNLLDKIIIRKALSYSIDRELISKKVSYGLREPLRTLTPPILQIKKASIWPRYNPNEAIRLFKKAGFCDNKKLILPLTYRSNVPADKLLALTWNEQIKRDLSRCLKLSLNGVESTTIYKQLSEGVYDAVILGWTGDYPDPYAYLSPLLDCKKIENTICKSGEAVYGGTFWGNENLQNILDQSELLTGKKRLESFIMIEKIAAEGASILPVWLVKPKVWGQINLTHPKFDRSGKLILKTLKKQEHE
ncbi:ABC transporter substrate-binding protein [Prochlorococcus marinus]|uniref:ABC transporter substrate-binding protein n=1 Tax=Prochlorococcus marinus TaxID=1219 RepID=UPI0022B54390|nr:ABC transporter substrate-binding protein [Prochlorococcus marinus]